MMSATWCQPDEFEIRLLSYGHVSETMPQTLTAETGSRTSAVAQSCHEWLAMGQTKLGLTGIIGMRSAAMRG